MAQEFFDRLDNYDLGRELGDIDPVEPWWVERQEALERAGYMLRRFDRATALAGSRRGLAPTRSIFVAKMVSKNM
jgi:hypothetical protein